MYVCNIRHFFFASIRFVQELQARRSGDGFILLNDNKVYESYAEKQHGREREGDVQDA